MIRLGTAVLILGATTAVASAQLPAASNEPTVIHAANMLDGRGGSQRNVWVVVRGGRIDRIATTPVVITGATIIDLGGATLLPGLIDAHVHPTWYVDRNGKRDSR